MKLQILSFLIMSSGLHSWGESPKMCLKCCAYSMGILKQKDEAEAK